MTASPSRRSSGLWLYALVAALLGAGWYPVLSIPDVTGDFLSETPGRSVVCLMAASVAVALWFRRFIFSADSFKGHLLRGAVLPYAGCLMYLALWAAWWWIQDLLFGGLANLHDTGSLFVMGITAAAVSFLVVIPYGLACQIALNYMWKLD